ncbi:MAG: hypothetical protein EBZ48_00960 [Proteobacteria bacterium]|nr:hypothetical protein [Pseudomonadota bacterium]
MQLHATLASFLLHAKDAKTVAIHVIFCSSNQNFAKGYSLLREEFNDKLSINWIEEASFKSDLLSVLVSNQRLSVARQLLNRVRFQFPTPSSEYLLFLVDDNLFVRPFCLEDMCRALSCEPLAVGFSLRLGSNTKKCYSLRCDQELPSFQSISSGYRFIWVGQEGDFGYPIEVSSSIYRTADLMPLLESLPYDNPNRLEQALSVSSRLFAKKLPYLLCMNESVAFCAPVNKVQAIFDNRSGTLQDYQSLALNSLFLEGCRVNVSALSGYIPVAAHVEIDLPLHVPNA